jgi:hypothetical protein
LNQLPNPEDRIAAVLKSPHIHIPNELFDPKILATSPGQYSELDMQILCSFFFPPQASIAPFLTSPASSPTSHSLNDQRQDVATLQQEKEQLDQDVKKLRISRDALQQQLSEKTTLLSEAERETNKLQTEIENQSNTNRSEALHLQGNVLFVFFFERCFDIFKSPTQFVFKRFTAQRKFKN